jgi:hypothetical protein
MLERLTLSAENIDRRDRPASRRSDHVDIACAAGDSFANVRALH